MLQLVTTYQWQILDTIDGSSGDGKGWQPVDEKNARTLQMAFDKGKHTCDLSILDKSEKEKVFKKWTADFSMKHIFNYNKSVTKSIRRFKKVVSFSPVDTGE